MKQTRYIMGMPITVEVVDVRVTQNDIEKIFTYFKSIDRRFSTYKKDSEISKINREEIAETSYSDEMKTVFALSEQTKQETNGYFDINREGYIDPSGLVKGWSIFNAAELLRKKGFTNYFIDAGGDIQVSGKNAKGEKWRVGIRNPFDAGEIIKVVGLSSEGIATSGTYIRGNHIYNPHQHAKIISDIVSLTVIGPNIYEADRFATAAFAMGKKGIEFIERTQGLEGYMIDTDGIATMTSHFETYMV